MQNPKEPFSVIETNKLSARQLQDVQTLSKICCLHDHIQLSYPVGEENNPVEGTAVPEGTAAPGDPDTVDARHWLCYRDDGLLCCGLALIYYEDSLVECAAFTHPDFRRQGLFSQLLQQVLSICGDCDILFAVSGHCPDTTAALQSLGAKLESREHQMELELADCKSAPWRILQENTGSSHSLPACALRKACGKEDEETLWELVCTERSEILCGSCRTSAISDTCACLHHVEIHPDFRRKGYGHALLCRLSSALSQEGIRRVILQVSGDNKAALDLYKKTGFRITETLSYYLY